MGDGVQISADQAAVTTAFNTRVAFVTELARRLHQFGTSASRLEDAVASASLRLGMRADVWSSPTAIIISFADQAHGEAGLAQVTQVMRLAPGDVNLGRLCEADAIATGVISGAIGIEDGARQLRALPRPLTPTQQRLMVLGYGLAAAAFGVLVRTAWIDALLAGAIGLLIGAWVLFAGARPRLTQSIEAVSAIMATLLATLASVVLVPVNVNLVVLTALIVLVPGMMLTTAVRELSAQHLASGVSRLFGALTVLLKLIFGVLAVATVLGWFGMQLPDASSPPVPSWAQWPALAFGSLGFAMVFLAAYRDWWLVAGSAILGYVLAHFGGAALGPAFGVFTGGLVLAAVGNLYARFAQRPGALVREPGIILLVPGSLGYSTIAMLAENNLGGGMQSAILLVTLLVALVAGLLFGDLLVPPRHSL